MKLSDFSSLVQLGIGLHASAAVFDLVGVFFTDPLLRKIEQIERSAVSRVQQFDELRVIADGARDLSSDLSIEKIFLQARYRRFVFVNGLFAVLLTGVLIWQSVDADRCVRWGFALCLILASVGPVLALSVMYAWSWQSATARIALQTRELEKKVLATREHSA